MKNIAKISTLLLVSCIGFSNFALAETEEELDKEIRQLEQEFDQPIIKLHKVNRKKKKAQSRSHKSAKNKKSITAQKTSKISQRKPVPITPPQPTKLFTQKKSAQTPSIFNPQASHRKLAPADKSSSQKVALLKSETYKEKELDRESHAYSNIETHKTKEAYKEIETSSSRKPWGLNVYTYFSFSDSLSTTNNTSSNYSVSQRNFISDFTGEYQSQSSFGLGLEYSKKSMFTFAASGIGFSAGASYDFERTISRGNINYSSNQQGYYNYDDPKLAVILPYANVNLSFENKSYLFAGLNYSFPMVSGAADEEYKGDIGYQLGFGLPITNYISLEVSHRWVSFVANPVYNYYYYNNNTSSSRVQRQGLGILEQENLELKGFNINLLATF